MEGGQRLCPGSWLRPAALTTSCPPVLQASQKGALGKGEAPAPSRRTEVAQAAEGNLEGRKGRRKKGREEGSGGGGRGRVIACLSVLLSAQEGARVWWWWV